MNKETEGTCQCCGRRRKGRELPSPSESFVCWACLIDPSPTFKECKHGAYPWPPLSTTSNAKVVDAIEYVQEIREIIDDKDAVLKNVTAVVEILNGILRDETVFGISVRDPV